MLDKDGLAIQDVKLPVYHFNAAREFTALLFIKIEVGTGLPGQATLVPILEMKDGFTQVFNEEKQVWEYAIDHRYKTAYDINTKQKLEIDYFGELKAEHTLLVPPSFDHELINGAWIITEEKQAELDAQITQQQINELESSIQKLENELVVANLRGKDITEILNELDAAEAELNALKGEAK